MRLHYVKCFIIYTLVEVITPSSKHVYSFPNRKADRLFLHSINPNQTQEKITHLVGTGCNGPLAHGKVVVYSYFVAFV